MVERRRAVCRLDYCARPVKETEAKFSEAGMTICVQMRGPKKYPSTATLTSLVASCNHMDRSLVLNRPTPWFMHDGFT
jgi:hypothetical protein